MFRGLEIPFPQFLEDMYMLVPERDSGIEGDFSLKGQGRLHLVGRVGPFSPARSREGGVWLSLTECRPIIFLLLGLFSPAMGLDAFWLGSTQFKRQAGPDGRAQPYHRRDFPLFFPRICPASLPSEANGAKHGNGKIRCPGIWHYRFHPSTPTKQVQRSCQNFSC